MLKLYYQVDQFGASFGDRARGSKDRHVVAYTGKLSISVDRERVRPLVEWLEEHF